MDDEYPRMLFRYGHEPVTVQSEEEEAKALAAGWSRTYPPREALELSPAAEEPEAGDRRKIKKRT